MSEIIKEYGSVIIAGIVALGIFTILFSIKVPGTDTSGIYNVLGTVLNVNVDNLVGLNDKVATFEVAQIPEPTVSYSLNGNSRIKANTQVNLKSYFNVTVEGSKTYCATESNSDFKFYIIEIKNSSNESVLSYYDSSTGSMTFPTAEIYSVRIKVYDKSNQLIYRTYTVPVDSN